jgi:Ras-related protein Rab-2A
MKNSEDNIDNNKDDNIKKEDFNEISKSKEEDNEINEDNKYNAEILNLPNEFSEYHINFKVIVIGNSSVGKTCITNQATKNFFPNNYQATIGMEIYSLFLRIDRKIIKLQIWDTCGQEIYRSLITNFYRSSSLAIIVYAINKKETFKDLGLWIKELKLNNSPDTKIILVGNKLDLQNDRQITYEEGQQFADDYGFIDFFETSAKTGENIKKMFIKIANILYEDHLKYSENVSSSSKTFVPNNHQLKKKRKIKDQKKCC